MKCRKNYKTTWKTENKISNFQEKTLSREQITMKERENSPGEKTLSRSKKERENTCTIML